MIQCKIYGKKWNIYNCSNFPYEEFYKRNQNNFVTKGRKKIKDKIYNMVCTFDTESTTIESEEKDYAFTYIWGFNFGGYLIVGRYYEELVIFLKRIEELFNFNPKDKIIIFVHNLSYDFQFFYQFLRDAFEDFSIFATDKRKILKANIGNFEWRCSYKLTNMSLDRWCKKEVGVTYNKLTGTMDYKKIIYPDENLKRNDFRYFIGDLISHWDCLNHKLLNEDNNFKTLPLTSTGYVREYTKEKTIHDYKYRYYMSQMTLNVGAYNMINLVKVGGDTHANRFYQGQLIERDCLSEDIKSSYPYAECCDPVPVSNFMLYGKVESMKELNYICEDFCCMFYIYFEEIEIKPYNPLSIISISKILNNKKNDKNRCEIEIVDNGRLIKGKKVILAVTDVRWKHIQDNYNFRGVKVWNVYIAEHGLIPYEYRKCVFEMFTEKCKLEKVKGTDLEYQYDKYKNLLNSTYGMCLSEIVHPEIVLNDVDAPEVWDTIMTKSAEEQIDKYNKKWDRHLYYAWGVWIVDNARSNLYELISCCGTPLYWDTDSCKGYDWDMEKLKAFNQKRINRLKELGFNPVVEGKYYPFGGAELDGTYKKFKSLGSKKYAYLDENGELHTTIAGVSKKGAKALKTIDNFKVGFKFDSEYAGQCAKYNDEGFHFLTTAKGHKFETASNIALVDTDYTLNASDDYLAKANFTIYERIN